MLVVYSQDFGSQLAVGLEVQDQDFRTNVKEPSYVIVDAEENWYFKEYSTYAIFMRFIGTVNYV